MTIIIGTDSGDALFGTSDADYIYGGLGNDGRSTLLPYPGDANLGGQAEIRYDPLGNPELVGGLHGGDGNDHIYGGFGADTIFGEAGADLLHGGKGADTFVFRETGDSRPSHFDTINDFRDWQGDRIDIDLITIVPHWIDAHEFTGHRDQVRFADHFLSIDTNGDHAADLKIYVPNHIVHANDLI